MKPEHSLTHVVLFTEPKIMLTIKQYEALKLIKAFPGLNAKRFAMMFWPDSDAHNKVSNQGNGACHGKAAWLMAGSYIGKLRKKGLVRWGIERIGEIDNGYYIPSKYLDYVE